MKKRFFSFFILFSFIFLLASCNRRNIITGSGDYVSKTYTPSMEIDGIRVSDIKLVKGEHIIPISIYIEEGSEKLIELKGQEEVLKSINITNSFGQLNIIGANNTNYVTDSLEIYVSGYRFSSLSFELSKVVIEDNTLSMEPTFYLNYATECKINKLDGRSFTSYLYSYSTLEVDELNISSSINVTLNEKSKFSVDTFATQETKIIASDQAEAILKKGRISNANFTLNSNAKVELDGTSAALDLVMSNGKYYGKDCITESVAINIGYGKSIVEVKALDHIVVNSAIGDCNVKYYGADPTITRLNISGDLVIEKGEEGQN